MNYTADDAKKTTERSPSYPFISLRKAVDRAQSLYEAHRKEPTRLSALADTWGYSPSSSGLQQTVAALKQFGLLDDAGSGVDRKVQISELGRIILADLRPGAKEKAIDQAARKPRLISEYLPKWLPKRPTDAHCISELTFDRGFGAPAAKVFLRVFDETVDYAGLRTSDMESDVDNGSDGVDTGTDGNSPPDEGGWKPIVRLAPAKNAGALPLSERMQVVTTGNQLTITAALISGREVDKLIRILQANKVLLDDDERDGSDGDGAD